MRDVTVITHSFGVATVLAINPTIHVVMMPGDYHAAEGATVGAHAIAFLNGFNADVAVLGASGLAEDGPSEALLACGVVYGAMTMRSARTLVAADASKFDRLFPSRYASWSQVTHLVSNAEPGPPLAAALRDNAVALTVS